MRVSQASFYGKGVFTTVRIRGGEPFLWNKHWARLRHDAQTTGVDISEHSESDVVERLAQSIGESRVVDGKARLTISDLRPPVLWPGQEEASDRRSTLSMVVAGHIPRSGLDLTVSPYLLNSRSPLAAVKSCNYLENILVLEEAKGRGFSETVRINQSGYVASAAMANLFWLTGDMLYTPALSTGCLPGTTREYVLENIECRQVEARTEELNSADAIFLTSAGIGVASVTSIDERYLGPVDHPILDLLS